MNPLSLNNTLNRRFTTYRQRYGLLDDKPVDILPLHKLGNISRDVEHSKKSSHRNIVSSHATIYNYWRNEDYTNLINFIKAVIEDDLDENLEEIGHEFLKGTDIKEKVFWSRKYNIVDDFIYKNLEKFLVENVQKNDEKRSLATTYRSSLAANMTRSSGYSSFSRSQTIEIPKANKEDAEGSIRLLLSYFEFQQKRKLNKHLFEPSVSELKDMLKISD